MIYAGDHQVTKYFSLSMHLVFAKVLSEKPVFDCIQSDLKRKGVKKNAGNFCTHIIQICTGRDKSLMKLLTILFILKSITE